MPRGFSYSADTKHERSLLTGFTVGVFLVVAVLLGAAPFALDFFEGPEGSARWFLLGGVAGMAIVVYLLFLFGHFLPILRSGKRWEYRVEDSRVVIRTPHPTAGKDLDADLEDVTAILQYRSRRSSSGDGEEPFNWQLRIKSRGTYTVPEGGGVRLRSFMDALVRNNPRVKWDRRR